MHDAKVTQLLSLNLHIGAQALGQYRTMQQISLISSIFTEVVVSLSCCKASKNVGMVMFFWYNSSFI